MLVDEGGGAAAAAHFSSGVKRVRFGDAAPGHSPEYCLDHEYLDSETKQCTPCTLCGTYIKPCTTHADAKCAMYASFKSELLEEKMYRKNLHWGRGCTDIMYLENEDDPFFGDRHFFVARQGALVIVNATADHQDKGHEEGAIKMEQPLRMVRVSEDVVLVACGDYCIRSYNIISGEQQVIAGKSAMPGDDDKCAGCRQPAKFRMPTGMAKLGDGRILVATKALSCLRLLSSDYTQVSTVNLPVPGVEPHALLVLPDADILVSDRKHKMLWRLSADMKFMTAISPLSTIMAEPRIDANDMIVLPDNRILIANNSLEHSILMLSADLKMVHVVGITDDQDCAEGGAAEASDDDAYDGTYTDGLARSCSGHIPTCLCVQGTPEQIAYVGYQNLNTIDRLQVTNVALPTVTDVLRAKEQQRQNAHTRARFANELVRHNADERRRQYNMLERHYKRMGEAMTRPPPLHAPRPLPDELLRLIEQFIAGSKSVDGSKE